MQETTNNPNQELQKLRYKILMKISLKKSKKTYIYMQLLLRVWKPLNALQDIESNKVKYPKPKVISSEVKAKAKIILKQRFLTELKNLRKMILTN